MEIEILKLVYDYSIKGKIVDLNFVDKLIEIVVRDNGLHDYVRTLKIKKGLVEDNNSFRCAGYDSLNKMILLYYESIPAVLDNRIRYECLFNGLELFWYRNLVITQIILHELEHASQYKKSDSKSDSSIETKLIRAEFVVEQALKNPKFMSALIKGEISEQEFFEYRKRQQELYNQYYRLNPIERLAEIKSYRTILNVLSHVKDYFPSLCEFKSACLFENYLRGYEESWNEGSCPSQVYLYGIRQENVWKEFDFYDQNGEQLFRNVSAQYNLCQRLTLGLPVSYDEYYDTYNWLQSANKFSV